MCSVSKPCSNLVASETRTAVPQIFIETHISISNEVMQLQKVKLYKDDVLYEVEPYFKRVWPERQEWPLFLDRSHHQNLFCIPKKVQLVRSYPSIYFFLENIYYRIRINKGRSFIIKVSYSLKLLNLKWDIQYKTTYNVIGIQFSFCLWMLEAKIIIKRVLVYTCSYYLLTLAY